MIPFSVFSPYGDGLRAWVLAQRGRFGFPELAVTCFCFSKTIPPVLLDSLYKAAHELLMKGDALLECISNVIHEMKDGSTGRKHADPSTLLHGLIPMELCVSTCYESKCLSTWKPPRSVATVEAGQLHSLSSTAEYSDGNVGRKLNNNSCCDTHSR